MTTPQTDLARDILDDLCAGLDTIHTGPTALELRDRLRVLAECGDSDAEQASERLLLDGCQKRVQRYAKSEHVTPAITSDGRVLPMSMRGGVPSRKADGRREPAFQQTLFETMSWAQFHDHVSGLVAQVQAITDKIRLLQRFDDLHLRFPHSHGPGEAASRAGTSLEAILAEVQAAS